MTSNKKPPLRVAILHRLDLALHLQISLGFYSKIRNSKKISFRPVVFSCRERDRSVMQEHMQEIIRDKYDAIVTVGAMYTQTAINILKQEDVSIPLVFAAIRNPQDIGIISSLLTPGANITGVIREQVSPPLMASIFHEIKPNTKSLLIPYYKKGDAGRSQSDVALLTNFFKHRNVEVIPLPLDRMTNLDKKVAPFLNNIDTIFFLEGYPFAEEIVKLSRICNKEQITLFVQDIEALAKGAGVVLGEDVTPFGEEAFELVKRMLSRTNTEEQIPVSILPNGRRLLVNDEVAHLQGIDLHPSLRFCLQYGTVIDD